MSNFLSAIVSYTLAALAGVCFVGGRCALIRWQEGVR